jgi:hypothetical protein
VRLEKTDFQARASANKITNFHPIISGSSWYLASLNATGIKNINMKGTTQLRLYFSKPTNNNKKTDYFRYSPGDARVPVTSRPQLIIYYTVP